MTERESHFLDLLCDSHEFFTVKEWMEKNMPDEWEGYLWQYSKQVYPAGFCATRGLNKQLNLSNLVAFLVEHREEWGVIGNDEDGFIFHPALGWWDKEE